EVLFFEPGSLICDEHDRSDSVYLIRTGLVKVVKNVSALLAADEVLDWKGLCSGLATASGKEGPAKVHELLGPAGQALVQAGASGSLGLRDQGELRAALNEVIKKPQLLDVPALQALLKEGPLADAFGNVLAQRADLLKKKQDLPPQQVRKINRRLLEALF